MSDADRLPRARWSDKMHKDPSREDSGWERCGIVMALYVYRNKKWLKIGEYCQDCGAVHIFKKYRQGLFQKAND